MKYILLAVIFFVQPMLSAAGHMPQLKALIVYDTSPGQLKSSYQNDAKRMSAILKTITRQTKSRLQLKMVSSKSLSPSGIKKWIKAGKSASKGVSFFYYAGQGLSGVKAPNLHSSIGVRLQKKNFGSQMTGDEIAKGVMGQNPRLAIILFDCYARSLRVPNYGVFDRSPLTSKGAQNALRRLFFNTKGIITASSSRDSDSAWGIMESKCRGGLFTSKLISSLSYADENTSWEQIMNHVSYLCRYDRHAKQDPLISVNVTSDASPGVLRNLHKKHKS